MWKKQASKKDHFQTWGLSHENLITCTNFWVIPALSAAHEPKKFALMMNVRPTHLPKSSERKMTIHSVMTLQNCGHPLVVSRKSAFVENWLQPFIRLLYHFKTIFEGGLGRPKNTHCKNVLTSASKSRTPVSSHPFITMLFICHIMRGTTLHTAVCQ